MSGLERVDSFPAQWVASLESASEYCQVSGVGVVDIHGPHTYHLAPTLNNGDPDCGPSPAPPRVLAAAAGETWPDTPHVFVTRNGRLVEPSNRYRSFVRLAKAAGMRSIRMHDARHGFATMMADSGKVEDRVLMELMGHSKISMTMDVYAHVVDKSKRDAIKMVDELLKRKEPR